MTSLSFLLIDHSGAGLSATRFFNIFTCCLAAILFWFLTLLVTPCQIQVLTGLYSRWTARQSEPELPRAGRGFRIAAILCVIAALAVSSLTGLAGIYDFNDMFPDEISVKIVAHRLGGNLGPENTLAGMKAAEEQGTWGCEMDVQRTKDGYYIINHDDNFQRVAGDRRKSTEMTLAEIQHLRVKNRFDPRRPSAQVSTLEEVLDEAKEKGTFLFVELKGETADQKMADDVTAMIREKGMVDQCLIMSLKYPVISYEETTYPEMFTGYIYSYSYGDSADLNCDAMILEVSAATDDEVDKIHQYGKKVYVWTVDTHSRLKHFLSSSVDAIITNEVVQAEAVSASLDSRSERRRVTDFFGTGINNYFRGLLNASDAASN
jgi:glycerophosphoryl diester phosphodiesterase